MVGLGNRTAAIPSVVHQAHDGATLTGDAADRRGPSEPLRVAREFKRRLGDPTPVLLGGTPYSAEALLGTLLDAVVTQVMEREGGPPTHLTVTHPANWGSYKIGVFEQAIGMAGIPAATTLTEPEAAALAYAANERVEPGALVAVYDLGGGTFDTAILRKTTDGFSILGQPAGIERLGGIDFDEAVVGHVRATLGPALDRIDATDPAGLKALMRLRRECVDAKEALSSDTEATIPVLLPGLQTEVRLTRGEFEAMIRPTLHATVDAMRRTMGAAAVAAHEISAVLLVGGSSRIPLVAELVSEAFGRPVAVDAHPKHAVALGAARAAALVVDDLPDDAPEARVIPFAATADGMIATARVGPDDTADLSTIIAASITGAPPLAHPHGGGPGGTAPGPADPAVGPPPTRDDGARPAVAIAERPSRPVDLGPYDDVPDELPDWLVEARDDGGSRRRLLFGLLAFVVLSVLAVGAGAFMTSEPRSEAFGDTSSSLPAPEPDSRASLDGAADAGADERRNGARTTATNDDVAEAEDAAASAGDTVTRDRSAADRDPARAGDASADGGGRAPKPPKKDPDTSGGGDADPDDPPPGSGGDGASEPAGGGGGATDEPPPTPTPTPDPPADDGDVSQQEPGTSEHSPSVAPTQT